MNDIYAHAPQGLVLETIENKLKNKIFRLLPEKEEDGEWEKSLDNLLIELMGYPEEKMTINYWILFTKLSSLRFLRYEYYRRTIFDCISLVGK